MIVDQAEEICGLLDLRDRAAEVLKNAKIDSAEYKSALNAVVELSKSIDTAEKRYFQEDIERQKLEAEKLKDKANTELAKKKFEAERKAADREFQMTLDRRKKEFWTNLGFNTAINIGKMGLLAGMNNLEYAGKIYPSTSVHKQMIRDALRIQDKL